MLRKKLTPGTVQARWAVLKIMPPLVSLFDGQPVRAHHALMPLMHIRLPTPLEEFVRRKVAEGKFESPDDVVCQGLRLLQQQEQWQADARQKIDEGWQQEKAGQLRTPEQIRENLAERKVAWKDQQGGK